MPRDPLLLQAIQLLSMRVGKLDDIGEIFSKTSCMNEEEREIIGCAEAYISMYPKDPFAKELRSTFIPAMEIIGVAKWSRQELTHLGGRIAGRDEEEIEITEAEQPPEVEIRAEAPIKEEETT